VPSLDAPYSSLMIALPRLVDRYRDLALAAAVAGLGYAELFSHSTYQSQPSWPGPEAVNVAYIAAFTVPLIWRRRRPLLAYIAVMAMLVSGTEILGGGQAAAGFVALVVAVFSGALYAERPALVAAVAAVSISAVDLRVPENRNLEAVAWGLGMLGVAWLLGRAVRGRQDTIGTLEREAADQQRRHDQAVVAATAAERASIARELHDIVAHAVSVIVIQSQAGSRALPERPDVAADVLTTIERSGRSALVELRRLLTLLSDDEPAGLLPAPSLRHLDDLVDHCRAAGLQVEVVRRGAVPMLEPAADLAAYRVVQEALTNTMRHASGATARLLVDADAAGVRLVVQDSGSSPVARSDLGMGRGLIGMRERLRLSGGTLVTAGHETAGFRIEAWLPVATPAVDSQHASPSGRPGASLPHARHANA
jgi:signal transduction histidine kinase